MAHITAPSPLSAQFAAVFKSVSQAFSAWLMRVAERNSRGHEVARLEAMSDAELAKRGIKRGDIALHVFSDRLYT